MNDPSFAKVLEITFENLPKDLGSPDPQNTPGAADADKNSENEDQIGSVAAKLNEDFLKSL